MKGLITFCCVCLICTIGVAVLRPNINTAVILPIANELASPKPKEEILSVQHEQSPILWSLLLTGDIIPARMVNQKMTEKKDFLWPVREIMPITNSVDLTFANLESPLLSQCPITNEGFKFCGDVRFAGSLKDSGIDIVNLANNHVLNYGWEGLEETQEHLKRQEIEWTGFNASATPSGQCANDIFCSKKTVMNAKGMRIGFVGFNAVGQRLREDSIQETIQSLKKTVDMVIVAVHWGKEYERIPVPDLSLAPDDPKIWGRKLIDWGADVVAGNHPHWYQGIEWYLGKPIFYALGNTVFDQEWSVETKTGYLAKLQFKGTQVSPSDVTYVPIGIKEYGMAYPLEGKAKEDVLEFLGK